MEMAGDDGIEARRGGGSLRGERGDFLSLGFSLQHFVVKQRINGAGCHERVGIGAHRVNGIPIIIECAVPCSARTSQIALRPHELKAFPIDGRLVVLPPDTDDGNSSGVPSISR